MSKLISKNPANNAVVGEVPITSPLEIAQLVEKSHAAKKSWKMLGVQKRVELLHPLLRMIKEQLKEIALISTQEMGKPISQSIEDIEGDYQYLQAFLEEGPRYVQTETTVQMPDVHNQIFYEPYGVVAAIAPWNYPFSNFIWAVMPNLIVGNTVVFKHSEECPLLGKLAAEMMEKLNLPDGVFSEIYGDGETGKILINQPIDMLWFTGSSAIGKHLFEIAGKKQIKALLEMGGSSPSIVFEHVKIDDYLAKIASSRFGNCGQSCDASKRLIVHESLYNETVKKLSEYVSKMKIGNPEAPNTEIGPLVSMKQLELLEAQVNDAIHLGAKVMIGGKRLEGLNGAYYLPTILTNITPDMRVWKEETFGPVLPVVPFSTEEEAIELANDTVYGLGAYVYSPDLAQARRVAAQIDAGSININKGSRWHPANPFGGYKDSGKGRVHGRAGFQELCQIKVIAE